MAVLTQQPNEAAEEIAHLGDRVHELVIVDHQGEMLVDPLIDLVHQGDHQVFQPMLQRRQAVQGGAGTASKARVALADGGDQVLQEALRVLVEGIHREPANRHRAAVRHVHQERGLAIPGGRGDQDQLFLQQLVEQRQQALPAQDLRPLGRDNDLGATDRDGGLAHGVFQRVFYSFWASFSIPFGPAWWPGRDKITNKAIFIPYQKHGVCLCSLHSCLPYGKGWRPP